MGTLVRKDGETIYCLNNIQLSAFLNGGWEIVPPAEKVKKVVESPKTDNDTHPAEKTGRGRRKKG